MIATDELISTIQSIAEDKDTISKSDLTSNNIQTLIDTEKKFLNRRDISSQDVLIPRLIRCLETQKILTDFLNKYQERLKSFNISFLNFCTEKSMFGVLRKCRIEYNSGSQKAILYLVRFAFELGLRDRILQHLRDLSILKTKEDFQETKTSLECLSDLQHLIQYFEDCFGEAGCRFIQKTKEQLTQCFGNPEYASFFINGNFLALNKLSKERMSENPHPSSTYFPLELSAIKEMHTIAGWLFMDPL